MKILVINCGSSSVKFGLFAVEDSPRVMLSGQVEKIGEATSRISYRYADERAKQSKTLVAEDHPQAFAAILDVLHTTALPDAIGHRVVHGGELFSRPTRIDATVIANIRALCPLAPLHNPVNLLGIEICAQTFPQIPQVAVFDTAFHQTLPPHAFHYAVPQNWYHDQGIRRYGFHGTSHQYLARKAAEYLNKPYDSLKLITLHLGNGASAVAIKHGKSIDTSMGFTPLEGLVMGSRSGDLDPMAALHAVEYFGLDQTRHLLTHESGLKGLCGDNDLREILVKAEQGNANAKLAIEVYVYRIKKYIGAYFAILGGVDALVFSGGVGENSAEIRASVCEGLECLGLTIEANTNQQNIPEDILEIQPFGNVPKILVIRTNEELEIALQTAAVHSFSVTCR
jgi:acetate kinase